MYCVICSPNPSRRVDTKINVFSRGGSRGRVQGVRTLPPPPEMTCGFLIQLVFCKKKTMWFIGVEVEQETSAPPPKKNPGSAPVFHSHFTVRLTHDDTMNLFGRGQHYIILTKWFAT